MSLWYIDLLEPLNSDTIISPAVVRVYIVPIGDLFKLLNKPLSLEIFALKYNARLKGLAGG